MLDFGLVKRMCPESSEETLTDEGVTQQGTAVGTLAYMAPEVLRGEPADARSEVWALGVILHELVAGARPFQGSTPYALTSAILREPAAPLPAHTPAGLHSIIKKCLAKEPEQRYQSAAEVRAARQAVAPDLAVATPRKRLSYRWLLVAAAILAILAIILGPRLRR